MGAQYGLLPSQVYEMTYRELELFFEGKEEERAWIREMLAWVQANLINIHIPRGKPKVKVDQLLPRKRKRRSDDDEEEVKQRIDDDIAPLVATGLDARARIESAKARTRARQERAEWDSFKASEEGRRYLQLLDEDEVAR